MTKVEHLLTWVSVNTGGFLSFVDSRIDDSLIWERTLDNIGTNFQWMKRVTEASFLMKTSQNSTLTLENKLINVT